MQFVGQKTPSTVFVPCSCQNHSTSVNVLRVGFFSSFHRFRFEIRHAMVCRSGACQATISVVKTGMDEVACRVLGD